MASPSVYLVANPDKPRARETLDDLRAWVADRAAVVGASLGCDAASIAAAEPDLVIVLGGDGSIIGVARAMGRHQRPIVGVNLGKLGFLAEFTIDELKRHFTKLLAEPAWITQRMMLEVGIAGESEPDPTWAMNDCVIQAGPPFRMIELAVSINGAELTRFAGDGLIIATPGGSTAHNMSAGGPILQPGLDAIVITPICPHSLTFRPIAVEGDSIIRVVATAVNEGTTARVDGQVSTVLHAGDELIVKRSHQSFQLVRNRANPPWHTLVTKLHWGGGRT